MIHLRSRTIVETAEVSTKSGQAHPFTSQYATNGRLTRRDGVHPPVPSNCQTAYPDSLVQTYDVVGNLIKRIRTIYAGGFGGCTLAYNELDAEFHWYDTDNRLAVVQRDAGTPDRTVRTGTWEEYHYDPFGRRISVRERRDSLAAGTNLESAYTELVWDGQQILYETRSPDGAGGPANRYGRVGYIHGRDLDAPVAYADGTMPVPDWRGLYQGSVFTAGGGADCLTGGPNPCVAIDWPAGTVGMSFQGWALGQAGNPIFTWKGSLTTSMRDGTGLMYRRNRYYDPQTGRFTQLDPIGLAGGSNGYGFPNGDPVNFADPFGLCPISKDGIPCAFTWGGKGLLAGGAVGGLAGLAGGSLVVPGFGTVAGGVGGLVFGGVAGFASGVVGGTVQDAVDAFGPTIGNSAQSFWTKIKLLIMVGGTQGKAKKMIDEIERTRKEQLVVKKEREKEGGESGPDPKKDTEKKP